MKLIKRKEIKRELKTNTTVTETIGKNKNIITVVNNDIDSHFNEPIPNYNDLLTKVFFNDINPTEWNF